MIIIGIDPGKYTGIAIWDKKIQKLIRTQSFGFWDCIRLIDVLKKEHGDQLRVIIENPDLNAPIFTKRIYNDRRDLSIAQKVGKNKRDAQLIIEHLEEEEIKYEPVRPVTHKWTLVYCRAITGNKSAKYTQHEMDAIKLVFGL